MAFYDLKRYQRNGYGRYAMKFALDFIRAFPVWKQYCYLSYKAMNKAARNLYHSFGFEKHHEHYEEGEKVPAILEL